MTDLIKIRNDILREIYEQAEPSLDFDDLLENPEDYEDNWYQKHTLSSDTQKEIFHKHVSEYDLTKSEKASLSIETITNLGPKSPDE